MFVCECVCACVCVYELTLMSGNALPECVFIVVILHF